ncbi:MAG: DUF427 domain-containing protein [Janthinobacterium lividum]
MPTARWNGRVIAQAAQERISIVEGNTYFPADCVAMEFLQPSQTRTVCAWKGTASYYNVVVEGKVNADAAWYYPQPKEAAKEIAGCLAFWHGVETS